METTRANPFADQELRLERQGLGNGNRPALAAGEIRWPSLVVESFGFYAGGLSCGVICAFFSQAVVSIPAPLEQ